MSKISLNSINKALIEGDKKQASKLLHKFFVETSAVIYSNTLVEDDVHIHLHRSSEDNSDGHLSPESDIDRNYYMGEESEDSETFPVETDDELVHADDSDLDDENFEYNDDECLDEPCDDSDNMDDSGDEDLRDKVADLESDLESLRAEFDRIIGERELSDEEDDDGEEEDNVDDDSEESEEDNKELDNDEDEDFDFVEDDFSDLDESFDLEAIKKTNLDANKEIGDSAKSLKINDKSPVPEETFAARMEKGAPVKIVSKNHTGFDREKSPDIKLLPLQRNQRKSTMDGTKEVTKEYDTKALLNNKGDGFGKDSPKSPVPSGINKKV